jgi:hypothetical protein
LLANGRILFIKNAKKDSLVMLSPFAFLLSIIQLFNWGVDIITLLTFILSIIVLLSNFHALFRYSERLYIDHYSLLMKVWSAITNILSLALLAGTIYFRPVEYSSKKLGITENLMRYEGRKTWPLSENMHNRRACPKEKNMHANFGSSE